MNSADVVRGLLAIETHLGQLLDGNAATVLTLARAEVTRTWEEYRRATRRNPPPDRTWGYAISPDAPLAFRPRLVNGRTYRFDVFTNFRWRDPAMPPVKQELVIRLWALDDAVMHRDGIDAETLFDELDFAAGRVMNRFHFDLANRGQPGPKYHLQIGGNARDNEFCWLHPEIDIPRLNVQAVDLPLACELIVANTTDPIDDCISEPSFLSWIADTQAELLLPQLRAMQASIAARSSVLRAQWNGGR